MYPLYFFSSMNSLINLESTFSWSLLSRSLFNENLIGRYLVSHPFNTHTYMHAIDSRNVHFSITKSFLKFYQTEDLRIKNQTVTTEQIIVNGFIISYSYDYTVTKI